MLWIVSDVLDLSPGKLVTNRAAAAAYRPHCAYGCLSLVGIQWHFQHKHTTPLG